MKDTSTALRWVIEILQKLRVPFQISGGLAARAYGARRELYDIDISLPEQAFPAVETAVRPYIVWGPSLYQDESWELLLMTAKYAEQEIDFGGAFQARFFDRLKGIWVPFVENLATAEQKVVYGVEVPVISMPDLIAYKRMLDRDVDREDIAAITTAHLEPT
jgi:hypothetical protein